MHVHIPARGCCNAVRDQRKSFWCTVSVVVEHGTDVFYLLVKFEGAFGYVTLTPPATPHHPYELVYLVCSNEMGVYVHRISPPPSTCLFYLLVLAIKCMSVCVTLTPLTPPALRRVCMSLVGAGWRRHAAVPPVLARVLVCLPRCGSVNGGSGDGRSLRHGQPPHGLLHSPRQFGMRLFCGIVGCCGLWVARVTCYHFLILLFF